MNWKERYNFVGPMITKGCLEFRRKEKLNKDATIYFSESQKFIYKQEQAKKLKQWTAAVKSRDCYKCVTCGATEYLHAHHIKESSRYPELRFDLDNGMTLCYQCHADVHDNPTTKNFLIKSTQFRMKSKVLP